MTHTFTLQRVQASGDVFALEYDERAEIVAAIPDTELSRQELVELLNAIEAGNMEPLDSEWRENAEWARAQQWGYPLTADDFAR